MAKQRTCTISGRHQSFIDWMKTFPLEAERGLPEGRHCLQGDKIHEHLHSDVLDRLEAEIKASDNEGETGERTNPLEMV